MAKVTESQRARLQAKGVWEQFLKRRAELKEDMEPRYALEQALDEFLTSKDGVVGSVEAGESALNGGVVVPELDSGLQGPVPPPPGPVSLEAFEGRPTHVSEVTNILWVADHMRVVDLDPRECPSLRAWNLLCECREDKGFRASFWKDYYGKTVPPKSKLDNEGDGGDIDGKVTVDLIDRITLAGERAMVGDE